MTTTTDAINKDREDAAKIDEALDVLIRLPAIDGKGGDQLGDVSRELDAIEPLLLELESRGHADRDAPLFDGVRRRVDRIRSSIAILRWEKAVFYLQPPGYEAPARTANTTHEIASAAE